MVSVKGLEMFEVGKKYKNKFGHSIPELRKVLWTDGKKVLWEREDGHAFLETPTIGYYDEYKEPLTITRYAVVYTPYYSEKPLMRLLNSYTSEQIARNDFGPSTTIHQIIPVTATIEG